MKFTFGKYKNTNIETNTDFKYLCAAIQHSWKGCTNNQRKAINRRIYELIPEVPTPMNDRTTRTIYEGEHYNIPIDEMISWFAFMKDLSVFQRDAGNLQIQFHDKFNKYKIE